MTNREKKNLPACARQVIDEFLVTTPSPTTAQWKQLIEQHMDFASEIADAAILSAGAVHLTDADQEAPLNMDAYNATVSEAINLVHKSPGPIEAYIEEQVAQVRGPAVRPLAADCGLGAAPALLTGVLAGSVVAPRKVVVFLAQRFQTSATALREFFLSAFLKQGVPSYKAENGKPAMSTHPTPWADAVRASRLSAEETQKLLDLDA